MTSSSGTSKGSPSGTSKDVFKRHEQGFIKRHEQGRLQAARAGLHQAARAGLRQAAIHKDFVKRTSSSSSGLRLRQADFVFAKWTSSSGTSNDFIKRHEQGFTKRHEQGRHQAARAWTSSSGTGKDVIKRHAQGRHQAARARTSWSGTSNGPPTTSSGSGERKQVDVSDPFVQGNSNIGLRRRANAIHLINSPARKGHSVEMARIFQKAQDTSLFQAAVKRSIKASGILLPATPRKTQRVVAYSNVFQQHHERHNV